MQCEKEVKSSLSKTFASCRQIPLIFDELRTTVCCYQQKHGKMSSEFVVSAEKRDDVAKRLSQIQDVFGVRVQCGEPDGSRCGDSGCILPSVCDPDTMGADSPGSASAPVWVQVVGHSKQACDKAKVDFFTLL